MLTTQALLDGALQDHRIGWSIGTFGAIGEFIRDADEPAITHSLDTTRQVVTARGGIRLHLRAEFQVVAYETLASDGETWGNAIAVCLPATGGGAVTGVRRIGEDSDALQQANRGDILYDLGIGVGHVAMCVRTGEPDLQAALDRLEGQPRLGPEGKEASALILRHSPNRVLLSPAGRIEVYAAIPPADGKSPLGPHTHLLPKLIASGRTHSANAPIPEGLQPVLMLHPQSPWRNSAGQRIPYDADLAASFDAVLATFGIEEDRQIRAAVETAVRKGLDAKLFPTPHTRRGRTQMRIALRRLAQTLGPDALAGWEVHDPAHELAEANNS